MVLPALPAIAGIKLFLKSKKFLIPAVIVALFLAIGGGTYFYLKHQTNEAVAAAVESADSNATIRTYETNDIILTRTQDIDREFDALRTQTARDYSNVRYTVQAAPVEEREAQAPRLLIDTLNELDRVRQQRQPGGVPDSEVPVG